MYKLYVIFVVSSEIMVLEETVKIFNASLKQKKPQASKPFKYLLLFK